MMRWLALISIALCMAHPAAAQERLVVYAEDPHDLSVTVYRDPDRPVGSEMNADNPEGLAMISETRMVTLPAGESTIRFDGVSEGMIGVTAIISGLPGGTIEMNRNAELLSPAALVNGMLGNRVTITRTNPATGDAVAERAVVRTRADGGLVLQSSAGFEAVRCSGLPERLTFDRVPEGLSAKPVFSIDTRDESGGTYEVTLTYISWGFDWEARYVATLGDEGTSEDFEFGLLSWLSVLNDNGQSFQNAQLLVVAGRLNIESRYGSLARSPRGSPLSLTCYPIGSTAAGSPIIWPAGPPSLNNVPPPPPPSPMMANAIIVTGSRREQSLQDTPIAVASMSSEVMEASEEDLGDLKLYRVPERVTVAAQGVKQVAFFNRDDVRAGFVYRVGCSHSPVLKESGDLSPAVIYLETKNEQERGLGVALPQGILNLFELGAQRTQFVGSNSLRDYARGQDVELGVGTSRQVNARCRPLPDPDTSDSDEGRWISMRAVLANDNQHSVKVRLLLGESGFWNVDWAESQVKVKDGQLVTEITIPADSELTLNWRQRRSG